jgi:peptidoglycan/LPS O-acetylase OafA/YrhL
MKNLTSLLRRDTGKRTYIPEIDSLRFVAIAFTIAYHLSIKTHLELVKDPSTATSRLNRGVQLFFVISGFVLALPFANHWLKRGRKVDLRSYMLRRLTRIEPPYLVSLLLCTVVLLVVKKQSFHEILPHLVASVFYMHSLVYAALSTINPVAWSLEIEVQFYVLVPLLTLVFAIKDTKLRRWVLALTVAALSPFAWWLNGHYRSDHSLLGTLQFFVAGFLLADFYLLDPPKVKRYLWDAVAVVGWVLVLATNARWWNLLMPLGTVAVYWTAFAGRLTSKLFRSRFTSIIGGMCYSIYLVHQQIIGLVAGAIHNNLRIELVSLGLIAIFCPLFYVLVERPCMNHDWPQRLRNRIWKPGKTEAMTAAD